MAYARNLVGGAWEEPGASALETTDPATGERVGRAPRSTKAVVDRAVKAAVDDPQLKEHRPGQFAACHLPERQAT